MHIIDTSNNPKHQSQTQSHVLGEVATIMDSHTQNVQLGEKSTGQVK